LKNGFNAKTPWRKVAKEKSGLDFNLNVLRPRVCVETFCSGQTRAKHKDSRVKNRVTKWKLFLRTDKFYFGGCA